jgi:hypothetical protein
MTRGFLVQEWHQPILDGLLDAAIVEKQFKPDHLYFYRLIDRKAEEEKALPAEQRVGYSRYAGYKPRHRTRVIERLKALLKERLDENPELLLAQDDETEETVEEESPPTYRLDRPLRQVFRILVDPQLVGDTEYVKAFTQTFFDSVRGSEICEIIEVLRLDSIRNGTYAATLYGYEFDLLYTLPLETIRESLSQIPWVNEVTLRPKLHKT